MNVLTPMQVVRHYWWTFVVRGIIAVLFGIAALVWPGLTLLVLVFLFGVYALLDGVLAVALAVEERDTYPRWWVLLIEGLVGIVLGVLTFFWPGITALVLLYLIAIWAIITGIFEIIAAITLRNEMSHEWTLALAGVLSVLLGILLIAQPVAGALSLVWLIGIYAIIFGIVLIVRGFQFRSMLPSA